MVTPALQEGHAATQTPSQGFEGPPLVRRSSLWLWPLKLEEIQTPQADLGLEAGIPCGRRTGNMSRESFESSPGPGSHTRVRIDRMSHGPQLLGEIFLLKINAYPPPKKKVLWTSLVIQWLRPGFHSGDTDWVSCQGTKMLHSTWCEEKKKKASAFSE